MLGRVYGDDNTVDETTLLETACKFYFLSQWRNEGGFASKKSECIKLRNKFIEKIREQYPQMTNAEVFNFFKILNLLIINFFNLLFNEDPQTKCDKSEFYFNDEFSLNRICWMGRYLQEAGDWRYAWLFENIPEGPHLP